MFLTLTRPGWELGTLSLVGKEMIQQMTKNTLDLCSDSQFELINHINKDLLTLNS